MQWDLFFIPHTNTLTNCGRAREREPNKRAPKLNLILFCIIFHQNIPIQQHNTLTISVSNIVRVFIRRITAKRQDTGLFTLYYVLLFTADQHSIFSCCLLASNRKSFS